MESDSFFDYWLRVAVHVCADMRKHLIQTVVAIAVAVGVIVSLAIVRFTKESETWIRAAIGTGWPVAGLGFYALYYAIRAPWEIHIENKRQHQDTVTRMTHDIDASISKVRDEFGHRLSGLERSNADLLLQLQKPDLEVIIVSLEMKEVTKQAMPYPMEMLLGLCTTMFTICIQVRNLHRISTTVEDIHLRVDGKDYERVGGDFRGTIPVAYGVPRSGDLAFKVEYRSIRSLVGQRCQIVTVDGTGQIKTSKDWVLS